MGEMSMIFRMMFLLSSLDPPSPPPKLDPEQRSIRNAIPRPADGI
jgi:hypothetical protein